MSIFCDGCKTATWSVQDVALHFDDCVEDQPCDACGKIMDLKVNIRNTKGMLVSLERRLRVARTEMNRIHDPLIQRVPTEIASYIFALHIRQETPPRYTRADSDTYTRPLVLASVCQRWREIAISTPKLWTTVDIRRTGQTWNFPIDLAKQWLARSGQYPLDITLRWTPSSTPIMGNIGAMIELLSTCCSRWRNLELSLPSILIPAFKSSSEVTVNLENLDISFYPRFLEEPDDAPSLTPEFNPLGIVLRPTHIALSGLQPDLVHIEWDNVTDLMLGPISVEKCLDVLRICPRVVTATFFVKKESRTPLSLAPVSLPYLTKLEIDVLRGTPQDILRALFVPKLQSFTWDCQNRSRAPILALQFLLQRSACNLSQLVISCARAMDEEALIFLLCTSPSIITLHLKYRSPSSLSDNLLGHLARPLVSGDSSRTSETTIPHFLPHLKCFSYEGPQTFSWNILASIYELHSQLPASSSSEVDQNSEQSQCSQRPLRFLEILTPDPSADEEFIDKDSLLRILRVPTNKLVLQMNDSLIKESIDYHDLTLTDDAQRFRNPWYNLSKYL